MKIFVAILAMDWVHTSLASWAIEFPNQAPSGHSISVNFFNAFRPIDYARNCAASDFMKSGSDWLLFIDADIAPPKNVWDLFSVGADIVGATCRVFIPAKGGLLISAARGQHYLTTLPFDQPFEVDAVGMGLTAIRRHVFEKMKYPYFKFKQEPDGQWITGEDFDFCYRAKDLGFKVILHPKVFGDHYKLFNLSFLSPRS